jgi:hypothetical protein
VSCDEGTIHHDLFFTVTLPLNIGDSEFILLKAKPPARAPAVSQK